MRTAQQQRHTGWARFSGLLLGICVALLSLCPTWLVVVAQTPSPEKPPDATPTQPPAPSVTPWEYAPYRIRVWLAAPASAELSSKVLESLRQEISAQGDAVVGSPWLLSVAPPPTGLATLLAYTPERLTDADIFQADKDSLKDDKIIWISMRTTPSEIQIRARELDCHTRTWGPIEERATSQPFALGHVIFDTLFSIFTPLARIEEGQGKTCVVRARSAGLMTTQESPAFIGTGDVLQPVFRENDRQGNPIPKRIQVLPYTFLQVTSPDSASSSLLHCDIVSGIGNPIHGRSMSRRERWALKVRPAFSTTELIVESRPMTRNDSKIPLAGLEVYSKTPSAERPQGETEAEKQAAEKQNPPELVGVTDWRGSVTLSRGEPLLRLMYVKNGGLLLARLPIVAGLVPQLTAEVPDDNPRLQVEGFVQGINGEITDLVAQRNLIRVRFRKRIEAGKLDDAQKLLDEFRGLKTPNDLQRMLDQQMNRQKSTNNSSVRLRIDKLYADERAMIAKYVDVELLNQLTRELAEARRKSVPPPATPNKPVPAAKNESAKTGPAAQDKSPSQREPFASGN